LAWNELNEGYIREAIHILYSISYGLDENVVSMSLL